MFLVDLAGFPALAPAIHVIRDRMVRAPGAVREFEEIRAGGGAAVDVARIDAVRGVSRPGDVGESNGESDAADAQGGGAQVVIDLKSIAKATSPRHGPNGTPAAQTKNPPRGWAFCFLAGGLGSSVTDPHPAPSKPLRRLGSRQKVTKGSVQAAGSVAREDSNVDKTRRRCALA